jgi:hypothetical protein
MSLCVCHLCARRTGADIGDAVKKARFDFSMTCEIMSNTTAHILYGNLGVTAVAFWKNTTAQFYLENKKSPPSCLLQKRQRMFYLENRKSPPSCLGILAGTSGQPVVKSLVYKALTPGGNMLSAWRASFKVKIVNRLWTQVHDLRIPLRSFRFIPTRVLCLRASLVFSTVG